MIIKPLGSYISIVRTHRNAVMIVSQKYHPLIMAPIMGLKSGWWFGT